MTAAARSVRFRMLLVLSLLTAFLASAPDLTAFAGPTVRVGSEVEYPPFAEADRNGVAFGFSVDLVRAVADAVGMQVTLETGPWDHVWSSMIDGELDVLANVAKLPERQRHIDFSLPHTDTFDSFFVREGSSPLPNITAATSKTIVVMRSDAAHHALLERKFSGTLIPVDTVPEGLALVASGKFDAFLGSKVTGIVAMKKHGIRALIPGPPIPDYKRVFCFGVRKGNQELLEKLNQGLLIIKSNGEYDRIYEKWLGVDEPWYRRYRNLIAGFVLMTAAALGVGLWSVVLRKLVKSRTAELAAKNEALEQEIAARARTEEELSTSKIAAEAASRAKTEFLANMSHEIRTPMNGIMGMVNLLGHTRLDAEQKEFLEAIQISSENLLSLINDILDLSKIEAGKVELEREPFSLRGSINDVIKTQISRVKAKGLALRTAIPEEVPDSLIGDELRFKQILLNLLGNAIKFTEKGGIDIAVSVDERQPTSVVLRLAVIDTGIGIRENDLTTIFDSFRQADPSTTRKYGGTGLGLSICRRLVDLMGGTIAVESCEGAGTTFSVVTPFPVNGAPPKRAVADAESRRWEGPPLNILVAEDQLINRKLAVKLLEKAGHAVDTAEDGVEAIEKAEHARYDLILMDIQMPKMDGVEAARFIRERDRSAGRRTAILAVTAHALQEDRERLLGQGFDGYVAKPIDLRLLHEEIRRCLAAVALVQ